MLVCAVVGGAATATAATASVADMTLHKSDLPAGFSQKSSHAVPRSGVKVQGALTTGYVTGWERAFTRVQGVDTAAVTSTALKYANGADAHRSVQSSWRFTLEHTGAKRLTVGRPLGDEARAITYQTTGAITTYAIIWRYRNIDASVLVVGLRSIGVTLDLATRLAVKQQQHIRAQLANG